MEADHGWPWQTKASAKSGLAAHQIEHLQSVLEVECDTGPDTVESAKHRVKHEVDATTATSLSVVGQAEQVELNWTLEFDQSDHIVVY